MNKQIIFSILLTLVAVSGWGQKVWNNPGYRNVPKGFQFDVNEVEFRPDETVLHITVRNHPNARFSFGKSTVLKTEDDKSYPIIYHDMPSRIERSIKHHLIAVYSRKRYYEYHNGIRPLTPDVERYVRQVMINAGWTEEPRFLNYVEEYLW